MRAAIFNIIRIVISVGLAYVAFFFFAMSVFFFDAPGSTNNPLNYWNTFFVAAFPLSLVAPLWRRKWWWLPLITGIALVGGFVALDHFCNGQFSCGLADDPSVFGP